jgi:hypothetical protein
MPQKVVALDCGLNQCLGVPRERWEPPTPAKRSDRLTPSPLATFLRCPLSAGLPQAHAGFSAVMGDFSRHPAFDHQRPVTPHLPAMAQSVLRAIGGTEAIQFRRWERQ